MSSVWAGNEAALIEQGQGDSQPEHGVKIAEPHEAVVMVSHLAAIERELRRIRSLTPEYGRQFGRQDGGQPAGTVMTFTLEGPKSGNDWYVERLAVSVNAVVAAGAVVALFTGSIVDESQLLDSLVIPVPTVAPSRATLDGHGGAAYFVYGGQPVTVQVQGIVAGNPTTVRLQGREVLSSMDPALYGQGS